jgi:molecular chaperone GrpE
MRDEDEKTPRPAEESPETALAPEDEAELALPVIGFVPPGLEDEPEDVEPGVEPFEPPAVEARPEAVLDALRALAGTVERGFDALRTLFEREVRAEATRERVVDRLHAELQEYKQDLLLGTLRPVFIDLVQLHDDIGKIVDAPQTAPDTEPAESVSRLIGLMRGFQQGIEDILYRQGVEPFEVEGDAFDPRRQRAVATVPTSEPSQAKTVATRHRKGFRAGEKVIRPEIVSVYALKKPEPPETVS